MVAASGNLFDGRGCLTEAGLLALETARLEEAPGPSARHLAGCRRCQERFLARAAGSARRPARSIDPTRRLVRAALIAGGLLFILLVSLLALRRLLPG